MGEDKEPFYMFQFHFGLIKRSFDEGSGTTAYEFQFHFGLIKRAGRMSFRR